MQLADERFKLVGVFGSPVRPTPTPAYLNRWFSRRKLPYVCLAFEPTSARGLVEAVSNLGLAGAAITTPFKEQVVPFLAHLDKNAARIGAVNTLCLRARKVKGWNTDYIGVVNALRAVTDLEGRQAVVLGAGGAARAATYGLIQAGCSVFVLNRTVAKAKKVTADLGATPCSHELSALTQMTFDILVNATSVGLYDQRGTIVPRSSLRDHPIVVDLVFEPEHTRLLRDAQEVGCRVLNGLQVLAEQATEQIRLWTETQATAKELKQDLLAVVRPA